MTKEEQKGSIMQEQSVIHHTFVIERNYPVSPERAFAAFADPASKRRWFAEGDKHEVERFEMDFRAGGSEVTHTRLGPDTPFPGVPVANHSTYLDIVPASRIVMASAMSLGGQPISASLLTFEFLPAENGSDFIFTHQAAFFEGSDGPERREEGWRKLFGNLAGELGK